MDVFNAVGPKTNSIAYKSVIKLIPEYVTKSIIKVSLDTNLSGRKRFSECSLLSILKVHFIESNDMCLIAISSCRNFELNCSNVNNFKLTNKGVKI